MAKRSFEFTDADEEEIAEIRKSLAMDHGEVSHVFAIRYALRQCPRKSAAFAESKPDRVIDPEYAQ